MVQSVSTTDGGRVDSFITDGADSSGSAAHTLHIQKYDAGGQVVGAEFTYTQNASFTPVDVVPLAGGGYAAAYGWAFKGWSWDISVFDANAHVLNTTALQQTAAGSGFVMAASPTGGFLVSLHTIVSTGQGVDYNGPPVILAYDNTGAATAPAAKVTGDLPAITTTSDGHYHLTWADGNLTHSVDYDPHNPPDFSTPAAPAVIGVFDNATGQMLPAVNGTTVDTLAPILRVGVNHTGFVEISQQTSSSNQQDPYMIGGVQVTAADVSRGYVDVPTRGALGPQTYDVHFKSDTDVPSASTQPSISRSGDPHVTQATDDVGPSTGVIHDGAVTDDATPTLRLSLAESAAGVGSVVQILDGNTKVGEVTLTSGDVSRGYVDVTTAALTDGVHHLHNLIANGFGAFPSAYAFTVDVEGGSAAASPPATAPAITKALDDVGAHQDSVPNGGATDDTRPVVEVQLPASAQAGDTVTVQVDGGLKVGQAISSSDVANGHADVLMQALANGRHDFTATITHSGVNGPASASFSLFEQPDTTANGNILNASRTPDTLTGGSGDDTLNASQGPDQLTGGAGHDAFVFHQEPWAPAHITDFALGTDRLDISALFQKAGYTGSDPVADGYVKLLDDGHGGTEVFFDPDGPNPAHQWPDNIIDVEHVAAGSATWTQIAGSTTVSPPASPPPASPPPVSPPPASGGSVQTGHDGGSNMTGGSGDDTLIGGASGPDTMTGGAGADHFQFNTVPWQGDTITDFTHGTDKIDVSRLLAGVGYSGSDPIADGYIKFGDGGQGNTWVYFDRDGSAGSTDAWGTKVATLSHVSASSVTTGDFIFQAGGGSPPPPPPPASPPPGSGSVHTGQNGGSNLVGGSGDDTLVGGHGADTMTGAGGADHFTWTDLPWAYAQVTDFTDGQDRIDVSVLLTKAGYSGSDPIADGYIKFGDDGQGSTWIYFDRDGSAGATDQWGTHLATLSHVSASTIGAGDFIFH